jgi:hypothetical protein
MARVSPFASLRCRAWLVAGIVLASAPAQAKALALDWVAPPECPGRAQVEARIRALAAGEALEAAAQVRVTRDVEGYRAELVRRGRDGASRERTLTAETCEVVADAVATVLVASQVAAPARAPPPPPASATAEARPPDRARSAPVAEGWRLWLAARPAIDTGLLPATVLGGVIDVGAGGDHWRGELRLAGLAPAEAAAPSGSTGEIYAFAAEAAACGALPMASVRLGACAGFGVALLHGRGVDVEDPRSEVRFVPAPKLALDVRWPAQGRIAVRGDGTVRFALTRPEFSIQNDGPLHRPSVVAAQIALGPELRF